MSIRTTLQTRQNCSLFVSFAFPGYFFYSESSAFLFDYSSSMNESIAHFVARAPCHVIQRGTRLNVCLWSHSNYIADTSPKSISWDIIGPSPGPDGSYAENEQAQDSAVLFFNRHGRAMCCQGKLNRIYLYSHYASTYGQISSIRRWYRLHSAPAAASRVAGNSKIKRSTCSHSALHLTSLPTIAKCRHQNNHRLCCQCAFRKPRAMWVAVAGEDKASNSHTRSTSGQYEFTNSGSGICLLIFVEIGWMLTGY